MYSVTRSVKLLRVVALLLDGAPETLIFSASTLIAYTTGQVLVTYALQRSPNDNGWPNRFFSPSVAVNDFPSDKVRLLSCAVVSPCFEVG